MANNDKEKTENTTGGNGGKPSTVGAVVVVGGGIAGMQASLDLTSAGYKVHLVTEAPALGGHMAQLDKTFPTNDCSTCMISPRLTAVGLDHNIKIMTRSKVDKVEGEAGNFNITVRKSTGFVNESLCNGCGACETVCPMEAPNRFNMELSKRKAIYKLYPQAVPNKYAIEKRGTAPCKSACPAGISVQGYVALIAKNEFQKSLDLIRERNPLPAVCGRVCRHPCEANCTRGTEDDSVAIRSLKKFVADYEREAVARGEVTVERVEPADDAQSVGIVGAGPAGLAAMYELGRRGYRVTVYEALPEPGGMLRVGIPEFRLPKEVFDHELRVLTRFGGEIKTNVRVGRDVTIEELRKRHAAVFISTGSHEPLKIFADAAKWPNVEDTVEFLMRGRGQKHTPIEGRVVVVGGGNSGMDVARTAMRLGSKDVTIIELFSEYDMRGSREELEETLEEGAKIMFTVAARKIVGRDGRATGVECERVEWGPLDPTNRRKAIPIKGSKFVIPAEFIVAAVGQRCDLSVCYGEEGIIRNGRIWIDPLTQATNVPGIFAAGDVTTQEAYTVIDSIAGGMRAAESIDRHINGRPLLGDRPENSIKPIPRDQLPNPADEPTIGRTPPPHGPGKGKFSNDELEGTFSVEQAVAEANRCLRCGICSECGECVKACEQGAVDHSLKDVVMNVEAGAMVLSPGFKLFDATKLGQYGYGRYPNVIVGLELERLLSASGPTMGHVTRRSDGQEPKRVAFIQCVGSRDERIGRGYCSSVCCMYATKQAIIAKEHLGEAEITIFYMDIRAFGKNFDRYYESAKNDHGIRYIRSAVSTVKQSAKNQNLRIKYREGGKLKEEEFGLLVLSTGFDPSPSAVELSKKIGVELNQYNFCATKADAPLSTSKPGVYVCGAFQGPKDIPESVVQASGAAAQCMQLLADSRWTRTDKKIYPPEMEVGGEPRVGVMICHCGLNIGSIVDVPALTEQVRKIPGVVFADHNLFTCSQDSQEKIKKVIVDEKLTRLVVASCSPRTHEPLFREMMKEVGLNPYLFEMANIRDQCTWVHSKQRDKAQKKAASLLRMAVAKVKQLEPLTMSTMDVVQDSLVIGGGVSGMSSAVSLANQGHKVCVVERTATLGGTARRLTAQPDGTSIAPIVDALEKTVRSHSNITLCLSTEVMDIAGSTGNYRTRLRNAAGETEINHGVIIVATGAEESKPTEYLYGEDPRVMTQTELEEAMAADKGFAARHKNIVMIQCVGSRNEERPYCSRVCCTHAVKNSLRFAEQNPDARVTVIYRDIRTYGFRELFYEKSRANGVVFIRHEEDKKPLVSRSGDGLEVAVYDALMARDVRLKADLVVLSSAVTPRPEGMMMSPVLKVSLNQDGFFQEAHPKLRPVDFSAEGVFLCGMSHSPMFLDEAVGQAQAASARAGSMLSRKTLEVGGQVAVVDPDKCAACLTCVRVCPFGVPQIGPENVATIEAVLCQGCGTCAAQCPGKAIRLPGFTDPQLASMCGQVCVPV